MPHNVIASHAVDTFKKIKVLNKDLLTAKSGQDKRDINADIDVEKTKWWFNTAQIFADKYAVAKEKHDRLSRLPPNSTERRKELGLLDD